MTTSHKILVPKDYLIKSKYVIDGRTKNTDSWRDERQNTLLQLQTKESYQVEPNK